MASAEIAQKLFADASGALNRQVAAQQAFGRLYRFALASFSDEDAASQLLEALGSEENVRKWVEQNLQLTENVLKRWYMTARLQAHEKKGNKQ